MPGTVHLLFGAALASFIPHMPTLVVTAFFSHYLLDLIPHIDADTLTADAKHYTFRQRLSLAADTLIVFSLLVGLYLLPREPLPYLVGAVAAQMPDVMVPLEGWKAFSPLKRLHTMSHWDDSLAHKWSWYLAGLGIPLAIASASLYVLLNA